MKSFSKWIYDNEGIEMPKGTVSGAWFVEHGLPMIVHCTCCEMTMALPNTFIDDNGYIYCSSCKGDD